MLSAFGDFDLDFDGIYDSVDDCVGTYDECGICNGPGPEVLAIDTITFTPDSVFLDALEEWYFFEIPDTSWTYLCSNPGCMDDEATNYDPYANEDDGSCYFASQECDFQNALTYQDYSYELVAINGRCWFAENLRAQQFNDGTEIPFGLNPDLVCTASNEHDYSATNPWRYDSNDTEAFGYVYSKGTVYADQNVCPAGWHVPTFNEFYDICISLGCPSNPLHLYECHNEIAPMLASSSTDVNPWWGTNETGFSAVPSGAACCPGGPCASGNTFAMWVSGYIMDHFTISPGSIDDDEDSTDYHSIRCIKD